MREQCFVRTSAGNFTKQIERAQVGGESEVESARDGLRIRNGRPGGAPRKYG